jgi:hypothetical protein
MVVVPRESLRQIFRLETENSPVLLLAKGLRAGLSHEVLTAVKMSMLVFWVVTP